MEVRYHELDRARNIFERYVQCLPTVKAWVRFAKFEMQNGEIPLARACYERAVEQLGEDAQTVSLLPDKGTRGILLETTMHEIMLLPPRRT